MDGIRAKRAWTAPVGQVWGEDNTLDPRGHGAHLFYEGWMTSLGLGLLYIAGALLSPLANRIRDRRESRPSTDEPEISRRKLRSPPGLCPSTRREAIEEHVRRERARLHGIS